MNNRIVKIQWNDKELEINTSWKPNECMNYLKKTHNMVKLKFNSYDGGAYHTTYITLWDPMLEIGWDHDAPKSRIKYISYNDEFDVTRYHYYRGIISRIKGRLRLE